MKEIIFYIEESFDGGYEAKAIGHAIFTQGENVDDVRENIKDAVKCHFDEKDMPNLLTHPALKRRGPCGGPCGGPCEASLRSFIGGQIVF